MSFFSIKFFLFFIIVFVINWAIPKRFRYIWLLLCSYFFYSTWNVKYTIVLLFVTLISFFSSRLVYKQSSLIHRRIILGVSLIIFIMVFALFKFWEFWSIGLKELWGISNTSGDIIAIIAPIGLSFYILTAIGYMVDVYRGVVPESNLFKYALFISFFPSIISGPIERSRNLLYQINNPAIFDYDRVKRGFLYILYGLFLKLLIANNLSAVVDSTFNDYNEQTGAVLFVCIILYAFQLYADFSGYSYIAIGLGSALGFELIENFKQPYLAHSINEFWKRWHISFSSWLKDYVYIPLGGNRKGKCKKYLNLMITFLVSGIWHGLGLHYIIWGALHGFYLIMADVIGKLRQGACREKRNRKCVGINRILHTILTFALVDYAWLFFRSSSLGEACNITKRMVCSFELINTIKDISNLMDIQRLIVIIIGIVIMIIVDVIHEKKISIISILNNYSKAIRWAVYMIVLLIVFVGVIRNYGAEGSAFLYANF